MAGPILDTHTHPYACKVIGVALLMADFTVSQKSLPVENFPVCTRLEGFQDSLKACKTTLVSLEDPT